MASISLAADKAARSNPLPLPALARVPSTQCLRLPMVCCTRTAASVTAPLPLPLPLPLSLPVAVPAAGLAGPCADAQASRARQLALVRSQAHPASSLARPGGLVITGRLEDVCAELDRLVALEELH